MLTEVHILGYLKTLRHVEVPGYAFESGQTANVSNDLELCFAKTRKACSSPSQQRNMRFVGSKLDLELDNEQRTALEQELESNEINLSFGFYGNNLSKPPVEAPNC